MGFQLCASRSELVLASSILCMDNVRAAEDHAPKAKACPMTTLSPADHHGPIALGRSARRPCRFHQIGGMAAWRHGGECGLHVMYAPHCGCGCALSFVGALTSRLEIIHLPAIASDDHFITVTRSLNSAEPRGHCVSPLHHRDPPICLSAMPGLGTYVKAITAYAPPSSQSASQTRNPAPNPTVVVQPFA